MVLFGPAIPPPHETSAASTNQTMARSVRTFTRMSPWCRERSARLNAIARVTLAGALIALPVALSLHALLGVQAPAAPPATAAGEKAILWFRSADAATIDARALLDAVAVYTRDLGLAVQAVPEAAPVPSDASAATAATATLRAQGARLGFWCELRPGADVAVLTVVAPDGHLELHLVERTGAHEAELYRAIGLKLRSVLTGTATPEPAPPRAPPPASPPAGTITPDVGVRAEAAPPPAPLRRPFVSLGYRVSMPFDAASPRHALAIEGAMPVGRLLELALGTALAPRIEERVDTDSLSVFDWPITAGARIVRRRPRVTLGGGLFAGLHLRWASAAGADAGMAQSSTSFTAGAGVGAEALARIRLTGALAGELRVYAELPLPTTHYTLRGAEAVELGPRGGVGLGLAFPAP
jgi:hypothetical protein